MRNLIPSPLLQLLARRRKPVVHRVDPTRTGLQQQAFENEILRRYAHLSQQVQEWIGAHNTLDLLTRNGPYAFATDAAKQKAFDAWLQTRIDTGVLGIEQGGGRNFTESYITSAYRQGIVRAYVETHRDDLATKPDFYKQSQAAFLESTFSAGVAAEKVESLATRAFEEMKGLSAYAKTQLNLVLADSMANGLGAEQTAKNMTDTIDGLTRKRARRIARSEIIRSHAEGQLDSFQKLGVTQLGMDVELLTADDDRVCDDCDQAAAEGPYSIDEARGIIPIHPNCRCAWAIYIAKEEPKEEETAA